MADILKVRGLDNVFRDIPALVGPAGPQGEQGVQGPPGEDGFSPSASVNKTGHTATITITDKNGTTTAEISDGEEQDLSNYYTKSETDSAIANAIGNAIEGSY